MQSEALNLSDSPKVDDLQAWKADFKRRVAAWERGRRLDQGEAESELWGAPSHFRRCSFENFALDAGNRKALEIVSAWASDPGARRLTICGPVGTGKTHLLVSAGKLLHAGFFRPVFWRWSELVSTWRRAVMREGFDAVAIAFDGPGAEEKEFLRELDLPSPKGVELPGEFRREAEEHGVWNLAPLFRGAFDKAILQEASRVVMIDDIGSAGARDGEATDFVSDSLLAVVDHCYCEGLPMAVTTNATPQELERLFGARTASRLRGEADGAVVAGMAGRDRRRG